MRKRILTALLAVGLSSCMLVGCGESSSNETNTVQQTEEVAVTNSEEPDSNVIYQSPSEEPEEIETMENVVTIGNELAGKVSALKHYGLVTSDGSLYMWGSNFHGQLGLGCQYDIVEPTKIMDGVKMVDTNGSYTSAVVKTDGSLWMWGDNLYGVLGDGTEEDKDVPMKVMDDVTWVDTSGSTTGVIKTDGSLWMWGYNKFGQLGDETTEDKWTPVKVMENVKRVYVSTIYTKAITEDGSLYVWGNNHYGEFGDGTEESSLVPVKVMDDVYMATSYAIIKKDNSLWMWGWSDKFGDRITVPEKVMDDVKMIAGTSAVVKTDGSLWVRGSNNMNMFGSSYTESDSFVKIMDGVKTVAVGDAYSIIIKEDGSLWVSGKFMGDPMKGGTRYDDYTKLMDNVLQ